MAENLTDRLGALEDRNAILELRATYCFLVDDGHFGELVDHWFTPDARCDFRSTVEGGLGPFVANGREETRAFFSGVVASTLREMRHTVHNGRIALDGDRASGDCYFELTGIDVASGEPVIGAGRYIDEYRRIDGAWQFAERRAEIDFIAPLGAGWVKQRFPAR
jgi:hypothetical protein